MTRRLSIEDGSYGADGFFGGRYLHIGHTVLTLLRDILAENGHGSRFQCLGNETMPIRLGSFDSHEQMSLPDFARVDVNTSNVSINIADNTDGIHILQQFT